MLMAHQQIFTRQQVQEHHTAKHLWIIYKNNVYDITPFLFDHPGGEEYLLQYGGQDITNFLDEIHSHSAVAFDILEEYRIGALEPTESKSVQPRDFIKLDQPMLQQVFNGNFDKEFYLSQVHIPRHCKGSAPIFGSFWLEVLTKTPWYVIPIVWIPVAFYFLSCSEYYQQSSYLTFVLLGLGVVAWSLIEYTLHRFLFHVDRFLPNNRYALTLHFLLHGIHHYLPMDRMRLVMPPVLLGFLSYWVMILYFMVFPVQEAYVLACGSYLGYICYDLMHYYLHHGRPLTEHIREMKTYHLDHHYKEPNLGFGITSKVWDSVFGTVLIS